MSTAVLVPLADYLGHTTDPDCEYLEGRLVERNVGEISHGDAQGRTYAFVLSNMPGFWPGVEIRVQVRPERYRVPDVVIVRGGRPAGRIITVPPEIAVEDRMHINDLHATMLHLVGLHHEQLTFMYGGRPFRLTDVAGKVATKILL